MKKILLSLAALGAVAAAAAPAAAQPWRDHQEYRAGYSAPYRLTTPYVDGLDWKITNAAREGRLSWGEARELRAEVRSVHDVAWRVQTGEAGPRETERLDRVVSRVEMAVNGGGHDRYRRYGDDRYERYGWNR
jgi:hypothetical protein